MNKIIATLLILISFSSSASLIERTIKNNHKSILKITLHEYGEPPSWGSGFFVSKRGHLLTAKHVIAPWLNSDNKNWNVKIESNSGRSFNFFKLISCDESKQRVDMCLLQVIGKDLVNKGEFNEISTPSFINTAKFRNIKSKRYYADETSNGFYDFFVSGFPASGLYRETKIRLHYKTKDAKAVAWCSYIKTKENVGTELLLLKNNERMNGSGMSGSPLLDDTGQLVGMYIERRSGGACVNKSEGKWWIALPAEILTNFVRSNI